MYFWDHDAFFYQNASILDVSEGVKLLQYHFYECFVKELGNTDCYVDWLVKNTIWTLFFSLNQFYFSNFFWTQAESRI